MTFENYTFILLTVQLSTTSKYIGLFSVAIGNVFIAVKTDMLVYDGDKL